jgi:hypothetical protein
LCPFATGAMPRQREDVHVAHERPLGLVTLPVRPCARNSLTVLRSRAQDCTLSLVRQECHLGCSGTFIAACGSAAFAPEVAMLRKAGSSPADEPLRPTGRNNSSLWQTSVRLPCAVILAFLGGLLAGNLSGLASVHILNADLPDSSEAGVQDARNVPDSSIPGKLWVHLFCGVS